VGNARNFAFWIVLFLLMIMLFNMFSNGQSTSSARSVGYSEFITRVDNADVSRVTIDGERIVFVGRDGQQYSTIRPDDSTLTQRLLAADIPWRRGHSNNRASSLRSCCGCLSCC
jgi:cell division protease FtsH